MLDFWNVNVPERLHTAECPPYLAYALENEKDRKILSTPDSAYKPQSWGDVHNIIHENRIDLFQRLPSQLRLYREYCAKLVQQYGTVMEFVVQERLQWKDLTPRGKPFEYPGTTAEAFQVSPSDSSFQTMSRSSTMTGRTGWTQKLFISLCGPNSISRTTRLLTI